MNPKYVQNISTLIHFMRVLHHEGFTMSRYQNECGTPACALGWASTIPALQAQGITDVMFTKILQNGSPSECARRVFGEYIDLFSSNLCRRIKTPQEWAEHATNWLKEQGHDVMPADVGPDFARFMDRVLKPVTVTA